MTLILVLLDSGAGFVRDHPPLGWRLAGMATGPMALLGACGLLAARTRWDVAALSLPFAFMTAVHSFAWWRRSHTEARRVAGRQAAIVGVISLLFLMLIAGPDGWDGGVVIGAYTASAALLGGLTVTLLIALTAGRADEVSVPATPFGVPARAVAVGLGITLMAAGETIFGLSGGDGVPVPVRLWLMLSLGAPLLLVAAGHRLFPRFQRVIWSGALLSALAGQAAVHLLLTVYPVLIPTSL
jgi:hypothetical protein